MKLKTLIDRLERIGIKVELFGNVPWVYLVSVNGNIIDVEDFTANYGFTVAWYKKDGIILDNDLSETFRIIRKYK